MGKVKFDIILYKERKWKINDFWVQSNMWKVFLDHFFLLPPKEISWQLKFWWKKYFFFSNKFIGIIKRTMCIFDLIERFVTNKIHPRNMYMHLFQAVSWKGIIGSSSSVNLFFTFQKQFIVSHQNSNEYSSEYFIVYLHNR